MSRASISRVFAGRDARVGGAVLGLLSTLVIVGPLLLPDPNLSNFALPRAPDGGLPLPSLRHPLGVDPLYRDELARLASGGRTSLLVALTATAIASLVGVGVGVATALAAKLGARWADRAAMRVLDVLLAFPFLLLVTTAGVLLGGASTTSLIVVLGLTGWTGLARVVRERARVVLEEDYVVAARALGSSPLVIAWRHVVPNIAPTALSLGTSLVGSMVLAEAVLGYLGVGLPPPDASWGRMMHEAETFVVTRPLLIAAPALALLFTTIGFYRLADGVEGASRRAAAPRRFALPLELVFAGGVALIAALLPPVKVAAPASFEESAPGRGGELRIATAFHPASLDPALAIDEMSVSLGRLVFASLLSFREDGSVEPGIVERWGWDEPGLTLRLELAPAVTFSDGTPLTAADVKRSIERALGPKVPSPGASAFENLVGFAEFREGSATEIRGVVVEGPHTLVLRQREADSTLPSLLSLSFVTPVCPSMPADPTQTRAEDLCGAGPFRVASEGDEGLRLARSDHYFEPGLPYLDAITVLYDVRPQSQRYRFERGELDLLRELSSSDIALYRAHPGWAPYQRFVSNLRVNAVFLNTETKPFDNPALRRAVRLALDPSVLMKMRPELGDLGTVVPPEVPGRPSDVPERARDLAGALAAMAEAGYPFDPTTGRGGYPEPVDYVTVPDTLEQYAAEVYQQQLAEIGIRLRLRLLSFQAQLAERQRRGRTQMGWAGWQADYPDPLTFFDPVLSGRAVGELSQNPSFYASTELDALLGRVRSSTRAEERAALFREAEALIARDAPWIPTTCPQTFELRQPWLLGYEPTPLRALDLRRAYLATSRRGTR